MKDFLIKAILEPFAAIAFCLAFGLPFVYVGFQTVDIEGWKDPQGQVTIDFNRVHYWGIWQVDEHIENVQNATLTTSRIHRTNPRRLRLVSGVFLETETEAVRLFAGSSNVNDNLKWETIDSLNAFIDDPNQVQFNQTFRLTNVFGWVGTPFLVLGVLGLIGWPASIYRHLRRYS
jgi:hypothetical protein